MALRHYTYGFIITINSLQHLRNMTLVLWVPGKLLENCTLTGDINYW